MAEKFDELKTVDYTLGMRSLKNAVKKLVETAQTIGYKISDLLPSPTLPSIVEESNFVYEPAVLFHVFPYAHQTDIFERFEKFLYSFLGVKTKVKFWIVGNKYAKQLYVGIDPQYISKLEGSFYSYYDQGDKLEKTDKFFGHEYRYFNFDSIVWNPKKLGESFVKGVRELFDQVEDKLFVTFEYFVAEEIVVDFGYFYPGGDIDLQIKTLLGDVQSGKNNNPIPLSIASKLFCIPNQHLVKDGLEYVVYRRLRYPTLAKQGTLLGKVDYKNESADICLAENDLLRHVYVVGKTGVGKTTFLKTMILSDIFAKKGVGLIDPHGDLTEEILAAYPADRLNDLILVDVTDSQWPISIDLFSSKGDPQVVASSIKDVFKKLFGYSRGPRLEYILKNALLTLVKYPGATLYMLPKLLQDKFFRQEVLSHLSDPFLEQFWVQEYDVLSPQDRQTAIGPIVNKVGQFLSSPILRNMFSTTGKIDFFDAMQSKKVILFNLSKGQIGEDNSQMLGSLLSTKLQVEIMARASIPETERTPFHLYIDEFHNFTTESFATIFSEVRKYKMGLVVANQYIAQIEESISHAIFGNVGNIVTFALGIDDAKIIASQFSGVVTQNDLLKLPNAHFYIKMMIDGKLLDPFSGVTTLVSYEKQLERDEITARMRKKYAQEKEIIEQKISDWSRKDFKKELTQKLVKKYEVISPGQKKETIEPLPTESISSLHPSIDLGSGNTDATSPDTTSSQNSAEAKKVSSGHMLPSENNTELSPPETIEKTNKKSSLKKTETKRSTPKKDQDQTLTKKKKASPKKEKEGEKKMSSSKDQSSPSGSDRMEGVVKLKYNYGLFVVVGDLEGLLHKSKIALGKDQNRKDVYDIGDSIMVRIEGFKTVEGENKAIWTQFAG